MGRSLSMGQHRNSGRHRHPRPAGRGRGLRSGRGLQGGGRGQAAPISALSGLRICEPGCATTPQGPSPGAASPVSCRLRVPPGCRLCRERRGSTPARCCSGPPPWEGLERPPYMSLTCPWTGHLCPREPKGPAVLLLRQPGPPLTSSSTETHFLSRRPTGIPGLGLLSVWGACSPLPAQWGALTVGKRGTWGRPGAPLWLASHGCPLFSPAPSVFLTLVSSSACFWPRRGSLSSAGVPPGLVASCLLRCACSHVRDALVCEVQSAKAPGQPGHGSHPGSQSKALGQPRDCSPWS